MKLLAGGNDIAPETKGIVITLVERHPGNGRRVLSPAKRCEPLADKRGFAEAGGCGYQREFVAKPFVESPAGDHAARAMNAAVEEQAWFPQAHMHPRAGRS